MQDSSNSHTHYKNSPIFTVSLAFCSEYENTWKKKSHSLINKCTCQIHHLTFDMPKKQMKMTKCTKLPHGNKFTFKCLMAWGPRCVIYASLRRMPKCKYQIAISGTIWTFQDMIQLCSNKNTTKITEHFKLVILINCT